MKIYFLVFGGCFLNKITRPRCTHNWTQRNNKRLLKQIKLISIKIAKNATADSQRSVVEHSNCQHAKAVRLRVKWAHLDLWRSSGTRSYETEMHCKVRSLISSHQYRKVHSFRAVTYRKVHSFRAVTYRKVRSWNCVRAGRSTWRWSGYRWCSRLRHVTDARSRWRARSGRARSRRATAQQHLKSVCKQNICQLKDACLHD